jgi:CubicO group peptidase (beta-lactamase class C family)
MLVLLLIVVMSQSIAAAAATPETDAEATEYTGEPITRAYEETPIIDVIQSLKGISGANILLDSRAWEGNRLCARVSRSFEQVPWDQILAELIEERHLRSVSVGSSLWVVPYGAAPGSLDVSDENATLWDLTELIRSKHMLPALVVAVTRSDGLIDAAATGVIRVDGTTEVTTDDRFLVASCAKAMTAAMIASLVEKGRLGWQTTISELFPEAAGKIRDEYREATLQQLLLHTAGVSSATVGSEPGYDLLRSLNGSPQEQREAMVVSLLQLEPVAAPGSFSYSNAGYGMAAAMAERATGSSWEELMMELFSAIGMTSANVGPPVLLSKQAPHGHGTGPTSLVPIDPDLPMVTGVPPALYPSGWISCSVIDLARWAQVHLAGLRGEETLLASESIQKLHQPMLEMREGISISFGWVLSEKLGAPAHGNTGSEGSFTAKVTIWPEQDLGIVMMTNVGHRYGNQQGMAELMERLYRRHAR